MTANSQSSGSHLLLAAALTPVHAGAGRSPGVVDLPVVRDPLGYPFIRGTMIKGALKTALLSKNDCISGNSGKEKCKQVLCALGPEKGESTKGASKYSILDLYPLIIPAPAGVLEGGIALGGIVYVTTPALIARAASIAEFNVDGLRVEKPTLYHGRATGTATLLVASRVVGVSLASSSSLPNGLAELLSKAVEEGLHPLYKVYNPASNLLVVPDDTGRVLIDSLLYRVTRVRLDRVTKTVEGGALWTEEYLPWATLLVGKIVDTGFRNEYCSQADVDIKEFLDNNGLNSIVVGGKESVGAGLLKLKLI